MKKKILYIDMDGVIADFEKGVKKYSPGLETSDDYPNYEIRKDMVHDVCIQNPTIFHELEPLPGAIESVKQLFKLYDVYFLTTPMWVLPESYIGKRLWIEEHFGEEAIDRLILTVRKDLVIGDILIDDRLRNGVKEFQGIHIHFGKHPFYDWDKTLKFLVDNVNSF